MFSNHPVYLHRFKKYSQFIIMGLIQRVFMHIQFHDHPDHFWLPLVCLFDLFSRWLYTQDLMNQYYKP